MSKEKLTPTESSKETSKETKAKVEETAIFYIYDRGPQGWKLTYPIGAPVDETGEIDPKVLDALKSHASVRNRQVHCGNELAMNNLHPVELGKNVVLSPEMIIKAFELIVEQGVDEGAVHIKLFNEFDGVIINPQTISNALKGKTHKKVVVPRGLREKYLAKLSSTGTKPQTKKGLTNDQRVDIVIDIERGISGANAGGGIVTSSTANTAWRLFFGRYRDGKTIPVDELPGWVKEARKVLRQRIADGKVEPTPNMKALFNLE